MPADPRIEAVRGRLLEEWLCVDWTDDQITGLATRLVEAVDRASQTDTDAVGGRRMYWHTDPGWPCPTCGHVAATPVPEDTDG